MRKLRICQFTPCLWSGGAEERIARVMAALDRSSFELSWIGFGPVREALVERAGPELRVEPIPRRPDAGVEFRLIPRLARLIWDIRPDVIHLHNWSTSAYGIAGALLAGVPRIIFESAGREAPEGPTMRRLALMQAMAPHISCFTTVCDFLAQEMIEHWKAPAERVRAMPTGIDVARYSSTPEQRAAVRTQLGIPQNTVVVGTLSVLRPVKRLQDLVDAVALLARNHPRLRLLIAGNALGVSPADLRERAEAQGLAGRLHMPGRIEDPTQVFPALDTFVNCSLFEGASNSIIEAMASGVPVVGTAVGGTPELIKDGENGFLVPAMDVPKLSAAIRALVEDPALRAQMGANGRQRAERSHTLEHMATSYLELYRELVEGHPPYFPWREAQNIARSIYRLASGPV